MAHQFPTHWTDEIARVSTSPEFQDLSVRLIDPLLVEQEYDIDSGKYEVTEDGEIWTGRARLVAIRWGVNRENSETANSDTISSILVQFPQNETFGGYTILPRGTFLLVDNAPRNPSLVGRIFTVTSDLQSGATAARTVEFAASSDAKEAIVPDPVPDPDPDPEPEEDPDA